MKKCHCKNLFLRLENLSSLSMYIIGCIIGIAMCQYLFDTSSIAYDCDYDSIHFFSIFNDIRSFEYIIKIAFNSSQSHKKASDVCLITLSGLITK